MSNKKGRPLGLRMTPSSTELGKFLQNRRLELKLGQVEVARLMDIKQPEYSRIEIGDKKYPKKEELDKLSKVLQCPFEQLEALVPFVRGNPRTELGKFIHARREELNLSLASFAERLGISEKKAKIMELRKQPILSFRFLPALAKALELENSKLSKFVKKGKSESALGQLVCNRRMELGMSTRELAKKLGISHQAVNHVELGKTKLNTGNMIERFAEALEIDIEMLKSVVEKRKKRGRGIRTKDTKKTKYTKKLVIRQTSLGQFITNKRTEMNLGQIELAQTAGVSLTTINKIETKRCHPKIGILSRIAKALKCEIVSYKIKLINGDEINEFELLL